MPIVGKLELVRLVSVTTQVVAGTNYGLALEVSDAAGKKHIVEATVWSRPWLADKNDNTNPAWQLTQATLKAADS